MKLALTLLALASVPLSVAHAQTALPLPAGVYLCKLKPREDLGWVRPEMWLKIDRAGAIEAYDDIIHSVYGKPIATEIITDNDRRATIGWTIEGAIDNSGQWAVIDYRITVMKADLEASLSVLPRGFRNTLWGDGACTRQ